jgi:DNA-binding HxlR family transcriptional regulator
MLKSDYAGEKCSVARALEIVGERWTLLIVRELLNKPQRFSQLERHLAISKNILASRLEKLIEYGIVHTVALDDPRDWNAYELTRKGRDLFPVVNALMAWGDRYYAPLGPPVVLHHSCGGRVQSRSVCEACGEAVDAKSFSRKPGPGYLARPVRKQRTT